MSINYLILYKRNETIPMALVEFHTSIGNPKVRNLKWLKDGLSLAKSNKLMTDLRYHGVHGYVARVNDLAKLPRNDRGNIVPEYIPIRVTVEEIKSYLVDQMLKSKGRDF